MVHFVKIISSPVAEAISTRTRATSSGAARLGIAASTAAVGDWP